MVALASSWTAPEPSHSPDAAPTPWYVRAILVRPSTIRANLERVCATHDLPRPNDWQLCLGVLRLWHRVLFRSETVGTSHAGRVRDTWRARALAWRALRLPWLLAEGAVVPLDFTGLGSTPERLTRHLLGAHHDANQFVYDLEVMAGYGKLAELRAAVLDVIEREDARSRWLRDLAVFDGYHEALLAAVDRAVADEPTMSERDATDPDISLRAYLRWCASQPATPRDTLAAWRAGNFRFDSSLDSDDSAAPRTNARPSGAADLPTAVTARAWSRAELSRRFATGRTVDPAAIAGWIYRGTSLGLPRWVERLSWIKFAKAFHRDDDRVRGWNIRIENDALDRPWRPQLSRGKAVTFGPFVVDANESGVVLDYGLGGGAMRALRDPIVALDDHGDVLLGRSLLAVGRARVPTPSYFLLERDARVVDPRPVD